MGHRSPHQHDVGPNDGKDEAAGHGRIVVRDFGPRNSPMVLVHQSRGPGADRPVSSRRHGPGPRYGLQISPGEQARSSRSTPALSTTADSRPRTWARARPAAHGLHTDSPGEQARSSRSTPDRSASAAWKLSVEFPVYVIVQLISSPMSPALAVLPLTLMLSFGAY